MSTSQLSSEARSAAAVSVVKNGLPVPAAQITTRPFSMWRMARRRMNGSQMVSMGMADWTRVCTPSSSNALCMASELMTVANMPIWSALVRSMPAEAADTPRKMLPPPMTRQISTPSSLTERTSSATRRSMSRSRP